MVERCRMNFCMLDFDCGRRIAGARMSAGMLVPSAMVFSQNFGMRGAIAYGPSGSADRYRSRFSRPLGGPCRALFPEYDPPRRD